jgi:molecular chaperone GrpE
VLLPGPSESAIVILSKPSLTVYKPMKKAEKDTLDSQSDSPPQVEPDQQLTAEQLEALQAEAARARENWDRLLRVTADFENFKKRAARERQDAVKYANESLIQKLLPVLDNFEMAEAATQATDGDGLESLQAGIAMVHQQIKSTLLEAGLEEVDATGQPFDPNLHEAVSQQESTEVPEGHVVQQLRKGYKLKDRLLRPASVVVAKHPAQPPAA